MNLHSVSQIISTVTVRYRVAEYLVSWRVHKLRRVEYVVRGVHVLHRITRIHLSWLIKKAFEFLSREYRIPRRNMNCESKFGSKNWQNAKGIRRENNPFVSKLWKSFTARFYDVKKKKRRRKKGEFFWKVEKAILKCGNKV